MNRAPSIHDTIFAPATRPGTGAISILRVSGPDTFQIVDSIVQLKRGTISTSDGYTVHFGCVYQPDGRVLDDVLVTVFRAPYSYTGEDSVEISCHASSYIVSELMVMLSTAGASMAEPGEFTQRAFLNGKMDLAQAEAVADVISSSTSASHRVAMNQLRGGYSRELADLRGELLEMTSLLELELDFSEEDVEFADRTRLSGLLDRTLSHVRKLADSFRAGNAIKNGIPVAIVGPPNAGKSTLMNLLVGEDRAIVSDIPGTTRDTVEETFQMDGILYRFIDTAGLRETDETIERMGIERALAKISTAEIVVSVLDITSEESDLLHILDRVKYQIEEQPVIWVIVANKCDLVDDSCANKKVTYINNYVSCINFKCIIIKSSLSTGYGLLDITKAISAASSSILHDDNSTFVTNQRHYEALSETADALSRVRNGITCGSPTDLLAEDLRSAITSLSRITGHDITPDEVLGNIFRNFCIGK